MNNRFKTVNLSYLEEISGGDTNFQQELIGIFLNQIPVFISNLQDFFSDKDNENLAKEAHTAKSSVLIFMMEKTGNNLKQIQLLAENRQSEQIPFLLTKVKKDLTNAAEELTGYLAEMTEFPEIKTR